MDLVFHLLHTTFAFFVAINHVLSSKPPGLPRTLYPGEKEEEQFATMSLGSQFHLT